MITKNRETYQNSQDKMQEEIFQGIENKYFYLRKYKKKRRLMIKDGLETDFKNYLLLIKLFKEQQMNK